MYKWRKSNSNLWLPTLHLKYFGGCFLGWRWWNWNVYWHPPPPSKKKSGSTPEHYKWSSGRHVPLFKIIKLIKIMRTYEQYYWSLKCQELIWSDYFHLISLCILINKTDLFFSGLNMHHLFLWQIVSQERRHKIG